VLINRYFFHASYGTAWRAEGKMCRGVPSLASGPHGCPRTLPPCSCRHVLPPACQLCPSSPRYTSMCLRSEQGLQDKAGFSHASAHSYLARCISQQSESHNYSVIQDPGTCLVSCENIQREKKSMLIARSHEESKF